MGDREKKFVKDGGCRDENCRGWGCKMNQITRCEYETHDNGGSLFEYCRLNVTFQDDRCKAMIDETILDMHHHPYFRYFNQANAETLTSIPSLHFLAITLEHPSCMIEISRSTFWNRSKA